MRSQIRALLICYTLVSIGLAQDSAVGPLNPELDAAKGQYKRDIEAAKDKLLSQLDAKLDFAARRGSLDLVETVKSQSEAFLADGTLPTIVPSQSFSRSVETALTKLEASYDQSIRKYVQDDKLDDARFLRDEIAKIKSSPFATPTVPKASVEILSGSSDLQQFANGRRAFTNRGYVWQDIPSNFDLTRFSALKGGGAEPLRIKVVSAGTVYIAASTEDRAVVERYAIANGWQPTNASFSYNAKGKTKMYILKRDLSAGEYTIPRLGWAGPTILAP